METATSFILFFTRTTSAASIAISAPAPIAIPTSASVSAGASLIPSPAIAVFPFDFKVAIVFAFPSGRTPAITFSMPAFFAIACAVFSLSPVIITGVTDIAFSCETACALSSFILSATQIIPRILFSFANTSGVFPSEANKVAFSFIDKISAFFSIKTKLPAKNFSPLIVHEIPFPGSETKFCVSKTSSLAKVELL